MYSRSLIIPRDDDDYFVLRCPSRPAHQFKGKLQEDDIHAWWDGHGSSSWWRPAGPFWCPYCGRRASLSGIAPSITSRAEAIQAEIENEVIRDTYRSLTGSLRKLTNTRGLIRISAHVGQAPARRVPPTTSWPIEEQTRVELDCWRCTERFAVYGRATFCWRCGPLDPCQSAQIWLEALGKRLEIPEHPGLPAPVLELITDFGMGAAFCEDVVIHGVSAIEAMLLALYRANGGEIAKPRAIQMVDSVALRHLELAQRWTPISEVQALRNCLVHRAGVIDEDLIARCSNLRGLEGQRLVIDSTQAHNHLEQCREFVAWVIERSGDAVTPDRVGHSTSRASEQPPQPMDGDT